MNARFDWWCKTAVDQIRYGPDREAVYQELYAHLEDCYDGETDRGKSPEEAADAALKAMGSASELAPQLAAVHRPFWGYVLTSSRWILRLAVAALVIQAIAFVCNHLPGEGYVPWFYKNPGQPMVNVWEDGTGESRRVMDYAPVATDSSDGFAFDVTRAVMTVQDHYSDDTQDGYFFWFQIKVSSFLHWAELDEIPLRCFWAVDSLGNVYRSYDNKLYTDQPAVSGNLKREGPFVYTMDMWLNNFCSEDAEWIEIRYDRNGRDICLRIDLGGGDGK